MLKLTPEMIKALNKRIEKKTGRMIIKKSLKLPLFD